MKTALYQYRNGIINKHPKSDVFEGSAAQLALCFGAKNLLGNAETYEKLQGYFPSAQIALCSTSGEIFGTEVYDDTISVTVIQFDTTRIKTQSVVIDDHPDSFTAGINLREQFAGDDLVYLLVLSDGSKVNGSELVRGLNIKSGKSILITGGLAGDGAGFASTLVGLNGQPREGLIVGIGFYGKDLVVNHGSQGGWEMFGLEKIVTRSAGNIVYEIDGENALELYKKYLGPEASGLPGSALLFPLSVALNNTGEQVVRTILSIDEATGSMKFAGDIPEGSQVRLMKANFDKLTNAASEAAILSFIPGGKPPRMALLISCVGRKLILQSRIDEEVEAVDDVFDHKTLLSGFYSYGELSPLTTGGNCQLHNQTMTITTFDEHE